MMCLRYELGWDIRAGCGGRYDLCRSLDPVHCFLSLSLYMSGCAVYSVVDNGITNKLKWDSHILMSFHVVTSFTLHGSSVRQGHAPYRICIAWDRWDHASASLRVGCRIAHRGAKQLGSV